MRIRILTTLTGAVCLVLGVTFTSRADSWCAVPLQVHEWGVHVFTADRSARATAAAFPPYFHNAPSASMAPLSPPTRSMPADNGMRALPIVQFFGGVGAQGVPLGFSVGFTHGDASVWYPQVDQRQTSSPQIEWTHVELTATPNHERARSPLRWVGALRAEDNALWVNNRVESERFIFYEGYTSETPAIRVERGPNYAANHRHFLLRNGGAFAIHDVFVIRRERDVTYVFYAPAIPSHATAGLVLEEHVLAERESGAEAIRLLRAAISGGSSVPQRSPPGDCPMGRNPAQAFTHSEGHRVFDSEIAVIVSEWGTRFFNAPGTTIVYREDTDLLDAEMPLALYTDMFHDIHLRRLGLALMENVSLP